MKTELRGLGAFRKLPRVLDVAEEVSSSLRGRRVPHAIVGGLAVAAYGWERGTCDVDLLVPSGREDIVEHGFRGSSSRLRLRKGLIGRSYERDNVPIDVLAPVVSSPLRALLDLAIHEALTDPDTGLPIVSPIGLVLLKLHAGRARDKADIIELLRRDVLPVEIVRTACRQADLDYLSDFELCLFEAKRGAS